VMTWSLENYPILTWAFFFGLIVASVYYMATGIKGWKPSDIAFEIVGIALGVIVCTLTPTTTPDSYLFLFLCGAIAICTMILPGISGSFVLVIMGKYEYIMNAIDTLNLPVLAVFGLGCIVGILAFAKLLHFLMARWEKQTLILLLGFVVGSLVRVWPWSDSQAITDAQLLRTGSAATLDLQIPGAIIFCVAGIALVIVIELLAKRIKQ